MTRSLGIFLHLASPSPGTSLAASLPGSLTTRLEAAGRGMATLGRYLPLLVRIHACETAAVASLATL
jgi:hypothetical protein